MDQALIGARGEWVGAFGRDFGFGRHASMADGMGTGHMRQAETTRDVVGQPDLLEYLHALAGADHGDIRKAREREAGRRLAIRWQGYDYVSVVIAATNFLADGRTEAFQHRVEVESRRRPQREFQVACGLGAIDGKPGGVRSAIAQRREHPREQRAEVVFKRTILQKQPGYAAHAIESSRAGRSPWLC